MNEAQENLLRSFNAHATSHSRGTLLRHLRGTHDLLEEWGNHEDVCLAGLFHSIYGTYTFESQSADLTMRDRVRDTIGERAEWLVYLFCVTDRRCFYEHIGEQRFHLDDIVHHRKLEADRDTLVGLIEIEAANVVEQVPRRSVKKARRAAEFYGEAFEQSRDYLSEGALRASRRCFADVLHLQES